MKNNCAQFQQCNIDDKCTVLEIAKLLFFTFTYIINQTGRCSTAALQRVYNFCLLSSHRDRSGCSGPISKIQEPAEASCHCRSEYVSFFSVWQKLMKLQASNTKFFDLAYGFTASEACSLTSFCLTAKKFIYSEPLWKDGHFDAQILKIGPPQPERSRF